MVNVVHVYCTPQPTLKSVSMIKGFALADVIVYHLIASSKSKGFIMLLLKQRKKGESRCVCDSLLNLLIVNTSTRRESEIVNDE